MSSSFPVLIVNFKTYHAGSGRKSIELAECVERVAQETGFACMVAVQPADIFRISHKVSIPVLSQHIDPVGFGPFTGSILAENVKENGAVGTILNHCEKRIDMKTLENSIERAREAGLLSVVCTEDDVQAQKVSAFGPDIISVEPPDLISTGVAVSQARPELISRTTNAVRNIPVLCGAGIRSAEDVRKALALGAKGILISSGVTLANDPKNYLEQLLTGFGSNTI